MMRSGAAGHSSMRRRGAAGLQTPGRSATARAPATAEEAQALATEAWLGLRPPGRRGPERAQGTEERKARRRPPLIPAEQSLTLFVLPVPLRYTEPAVFLKNDRVQEGLFAKRAQFVVPPRDSHRMPVARRFHACTVSLIA
jgi:hypothetical protein